MKFSEIDVQVARLAYPLFSNQEIALHIGCSIAWLEKLAQKYGLSKADYNFYPNQSGYPRDLTSYRFGKLFVMHKMQHKEKNNIMWVCVCDCGKQIRCRASVLRKGLKVDCGYCKLKVSETRKRSGEMGSWVWSKIKSHASERGIPVTVNCEDVINLFKQQNGKCALTGLPISFPKIVRGIKDGTASLDRIDSSKPYESGNLQWIHKHINLMKHSFNQYYFIELCSKVAKYNS